MKKLADSLDALCYTGRKFKKRTFTHKLTGYQYEISHFENFNGIRGQIKSETRDWIMYKLFVIGIPILVTLISFYLVLSCI